MLLVSLLAISFLSTNASALVGYVDVLPGAIGGRSLTLNQESDFEIEVTGSGHNHFNVYIVTEHNHQRQMNNLSFGYIYELSRTNVTSVQIIP